MIMMIIWKIKIWLVQMTNMDHHQTTRVMKNLIDLLLKTPMYKVKKERPKARKISRRTKTQSTNQVTSQMIKTQEVHNLFQPQTRITMEKLSNEGFKSKLIIQN